MASDESLDTYAHRLMVLLAVTSGRSLIDDLVSRVGALLRYQLDARRQHDPIDADSAIAAMEEKIRRAPMSGRDLKRKIHYDRAGLWVFNTALGNLINAGEVVRQPQRDVFWRSEEGAPVTVSVTTARKDVPANANASL